MAWRWSTLTSGDLVTKSPTPAWQSASSGLWEYKGLKGEDPGVLTNQFQPEKNKERKREGPSDLFTWNGRKSRWEEMLGEMILDDRLE
ncbi:unnamed protein product [Caretta caretta]